MMKTAVADIQLHWDQASYSIGDTVMVDLDGDDNPQLEMNFG